MADTIVGADTFVESSGDVLLQNHTPTGPNAAAGWVEHDFLPSGIARVIDGLGVVRNSAADGWYYITDTVTAAQYAELDLELSSTTFTKTPGPAVRMQATGTDTAYWIRVLKAGNVIELRRHVGGSATLLDTISFTPSATTVYRLRLEVSDNVSGNPELVVSVDGVAQTFVTAGTTVYEDTSGSKITSAGHVGIAFGVSAQSDVSNFEGGNISAPDAVLLDTTPGDLTGYQCDASNEYALAISGTVTGDTSAADVQYRLVEHGTDTALSGHDWQTLSSVSAGAWSGTITGIPAGGYYNLDIRSREADTTVIVTNERTERIYVGDLFLVIIPSAARDFFETGTSYTQTELGSQYTGTTDSGETLNVWAAAAASGCRKLIDVIASVTGRPVGLIKAGVGGSALVYTSASGGYWTNLAASAPWDNCLGIMDAVGDTIAGIVFFVGANDAAPGTVTEADWETGFATLRTRIASEFTPGRGMSSIPMFVMETGRGEAGEPTHSDAGFDAIRNAAADVVDTHDNVYHGAVLIDQTLTDGIHLDDAGNIAAATRVGNAILSFLGETAVYPGPKIQKWSQSSPGTTTTVHLTHGAGTDFTPTTGIDLFEVNLSGVGWTAATGARADASTITLTHTSGTTVGVRHAYGANPSRTNLVKDNSSLSLPVWPSGAVNENSAPAFDGPSISISDLALNSAMASVDVSGRFSDADADPLTYDKAGTWPAGLTVTSGGVIQGTPTETGVFAGLTVTATDGIDSASSNTFTITVEEQVPAAFVAWRRKHRRLLR